MRALRALAVATFVLLAGLVGPARAEDKVDHSSFDAQLKRYVDDKGLVDYKTWKEKDAKALDAYIAKLGSVDEGKLSRGEKFALWINAYNAITIKSVIDKYPIKSIKDIDAWKAEVWTVAGKKNISLDHIEHKILRPMGDPRIHFAIVCASKGCPFLRAGAFTGDKIDEQLEEQVQKALGDPSKTKVDAGSKTVYASKVLDWFGDDFGASETQRLTWLAKHFKDPASKKVALDNDAKLKFMDWDWSLNER